MKGRAFIAAILCLGLCACGPTASPSGNADFAVLAQAADGYTPARRGHKLQFPRDHGSHGDFRIEWWYLTANLLSETGDQYGAQWTLFRLATGLPEASVSGNPWHGRQMYMGHFALTRSDGHVAFQRYARGGSHAGEARAGVVWTPFEAWLDDWHLRSTGPGWLPLQAFASQANHGLDLELKSDRPLVLQGEQGFSQKHPGGGGSHYYSHPFLQASGTLTIDGQVFSVSGPAWFDHEWSSQFLQPDQQGWDWFALHLDSGEKLMLFRLRGREESGPGGEYRHGVVISPDGRAQTLKGDAIGFSEQRHATVAGRQLPVEWRISLPDIDRRLTVEALHPEQWMDLDFPYWEGVVNVNGEDPASRGVGYLEMTGYPVESR